MAMAQTAFRARPAFYRHSSVAARRSQRAEMPLFQAFLRPSSGEVTDGHCIKDTTTTDPACGSGNFLTETYLSLRRLENDIIFLRYGGQVGLDFTSPVQVSINQFYGIEINDFAVTVAKTALWIAESQMLLETEKIIANYDLQFLPLKTQANIIEGNALCMDWNEVIPKYELNYIMGNPPFVGYKFQSATQKNGINAVAGEFENYGTLDYVSGWYVKAAKYMYGTKIACAFVSTKPALKAQQQTLMIEADSLFSLEHYLLLIARWCTCLL